jgi:lipoate-protein ligase A
VPRLTLSDEDWQDIQTISEERYHTWEWNIGRSPRFMRSQQTQIAGLELKVQVVVDKGLVSQISGSGPLWSAPLAARLNELLKGVRYDGEELQQTLHPWQQQLFPSPLSLDMVVTLLYG